MNCHKMSDILYISGLGRSCDKHGLRFIDPKKLEIVFQFAQRICKFAISFIYNILYEFE